MTTPYDIFGHKVSILPEHYRIHSGFSFMAGYSWSLSSTTIADNASVMLHIAPTRAMHLIIDIDVTGDFEVHSYEGSSTATTAATALTVFNKNRYSNKTSGATISYGTTLATTSLGTAFPGHVLPGGVKGAGSGGTGQGFAREIVLNANYNYSTVITNRSGGIQSASINYEWYEPGASS